ncbi:hypothetical protein Y032_0034g2833 [Ancylostoma ceylanicum]|nr:hypothetical protein Y032_0034g2833 [Ancylostoma ceylanicum]
MLAPPFSHFSHESPMNNGSTNNIQRIPNDDNSCNDLGFVEWISQQKRTINEHIWTSVEIATDGGRQLPAFQ